MKFELGQGVACDLDSLVDSRLLVQANSGGGKSWCIRRLLEQTFGHVQHLVIDPEGEFASLREKFDYVLAAKNGGDTVADPRSAKLLARRLLELNASAILDIYELKAHERVLFVRYFLEALVDAPKNLWHPTLVIIDEAHVYCPQKGEAQSAPAVIDLATRGRKRGFCAVLATQRLSKLHKDAAAECNNKLIGRSLEIDAKRAADELGFAGREAWQEMRLLAPGEFFSYGPSLTIDVTKVRIGDVQTTHPKAGARIAFTAPPPTDKVRAMLPKLSDLPKEAEAERQSMADMKRDLATARRELTLARRTSAPPDEAVITQRVTVAVASERNALEKLLKRQGDVQGREMKRLERVIDTASRELSGVAERLTKATNGGSHGATRGRTGQAGNDSVPPAQRPEASRRSEGVHEGGNGASPTRRDSRAPGLGDETGEPLEGIRAGAVRILKELARRHPLNWTKAQVAQLTGYTASGGTFTAYIGDLRRAGLIAINGKDVTVTDEGLDAAGEVPAAPMTHEEVLAMWRDKMRAGEFRLLEAIAEAGEEGIERNVLAEQTEYTMTGGTFTAYIGTLSRNALIEKRGSLLIPSPTLWPEYLA